VTRWMGGGVPVRSLARSLSACQLISRCGRGSMRGGVAWPGEAGRGGARPCPYSRPTAPRAPRGKASIAIAWRRCAGGERGGEDQRMRIASPLPVLGPAPGNRIAPESIGGRKKLVAWR
jgi:hypothetical protein